MVYTLCDFLCAGQTSVIKTQQTVLVEVRGNAFLNCQLMQFKDIVQVTWQKILAEGKWNLTSYHKTFGKKVNPGCLHKTEFKYAGLQNGSLVIKNVTEQDEGCYVCLFDVQHESPLRGKTCIQVYELHEPVVDVRESNSTEEWVVSRSATGRPAPTVTLSVSQQDLNFSQYNTVSVSNTNATFTVTTTAVLSGSCKHSTQVGCAARVLSAPHREVMVTIHEEKDFYLMLVIIILIIASVLVVCGCAAVITVLLTKIPEQVFFSNSICSA
uniref:Ig-like domain-containing protein n=1 Tax=Oreochromis aureus TaxID=47969 RepID=A0A668TX14_OREAU